MRFSVLTPVYNTSAFLTACADSVLSQDFPDFELVLVDDGSTDGSGALCDALCARDPARVRVVHTENRGLLAARRRAIAEARGEICVSLDSDDLLAPGALSVIDARMRGPERPELLLFNFACFTDPAGPFDVEPPVFEDGRAFYGEADKLAVYAELLSGWRLNNFVTKAIETALLRRDDTDYAPYFACPHSEDLLQSLYPVTEARRIAYCALPLYRYRRNAQSMTRALDLASLDRQFNRPVMDKLASYMPHWGMDTPEWRARFAVRRLTGLLSAFRQAYRAAKNGAERRAVVNYRWAEMVDADTLSYMRSAYMGRADALQLSLLLKKRAFALRLFALLARLARPLRRKGR